MQVKKQLRDMEAKLKDQEEELDEQAGTIQMLEQVQMQHMEYSASFINLCPENKPLIFTHQADNMTIHSF